MGAPISTSTYKFSLTISHADNAEDTFFPFSTACGMNDETAFALASAMRDVPWPAGTRAFVTVERIDTTTADFAGDLSTQTFN